MNVLSVCHCGHNRSMHCNPKYESLSMCWYSAPGERCFCQEFRHGNLKYQIGINKHIEGYFNNN